MVELVCGCGSAASPAVSWKNRRSRPAALGGREPVQYDAVGHRSASDGLGLGLDQLSVPVGWVYGEAGALQRGVQSGEVGRLVLLAFRVD